jgi:hypothetical protein
MKLRYFIKLYTFLGCTLFISTTVFPQKSLSNWLISTGNKGWDIVNDLTCDTTSTLYITGSHIDTIANKQLKVIPPNLSKFNFISKYDTGGNLKWTKQLFNSNPGYGSLVKSIRTNLLAVVGSSVRNTEKGHPYVGKLDYFLTLLDSSGVTKWTKTFTGEIHNYFTCISNNTVNGDIVLGGYYRDSLLIDQLVLNSKGKSTGVICCYSEKGELKFLRTIQGKGDGKVFSISHDKKGNFHVLGTFTKSLQTEANRTINCPNGQTGIFISNYSNNGACLTVKYIGSGKKVLVNSIVDDGHNCYISGSFSDILTIGNEKINSNGSDDIFILCMNEFSNIRWIKQIGGTRKDRASKLRVLNNEIILSGSFCGKLKIDSISISSNNESSDILIASLDTTGKVNWIRQLGGESDDYPTGMELTQKGYVYISGSFRKNFQVSEKSANSNGEEDLFVGRLENCKKNAPKFKTPEKVCEGQELVLNAGAGFSYYDWNNGYSHSQEITVKDQGEYSLLLKSKDGCILYDTISVIINPTPDVIIGNDTTINDTSHIVLRTNKRYQTYLWNTGSKEPQINIYGFNCNEGSNYYTVQVTNEDGCVGNGQININVTRVVPTASSRLLAKSFLVYPNPTSGLVTIVFSEDYDNLTLRLYDSFGKEVSLKTLNHYYKNVPLEFNLDSYQPGLFTLIINTQEGVICEKIILE